MITIAGTGHRPQFAETDKLAAFTEAQENAMTNAAKHYLKTLSAGYVISGGALGWDTCLARAASMLSIPYAVYVPCLGFGSQWDAKQQETYNKMLAYADTWKVVSEKPYASSLMIIRDKAMVADCDKLLALWNGREKGGTFKTVTYAKKLGKEVVNAWDYYEGLGE